MDITISVDTECEDAWSVSGSSAAAIVGGATQFAFDGNVDDWVLCYKHGTDDWRLYTGITPTSTSSKSAADSTISDTQLTQAAVSLTLEGNIASYPEDSTARMNFLSAFRVDLAGALGVDTSRFTITGIRAGSVVIDFTIDPTG